MSYFPVTPDRSGEIMATGMMGAADMNRQTMTGLGENIGGALSDLGKSYGEYIENRIDDMGALKVVKGLADSGYKPFGDIYKNLMGLGPKAAGRAARTVVGDAGGWISQVMIAGMNRDLGQQRINQGYSMPYYRAQATNQQNQAAAGPVFNGTMLPNFSQGNP